MASRSIINKHFLRGERSGLEEIEIILKNNFFSFVFLILRDHHPSLYLSALLLLIQYLQLHFFLFHSLVNPRFFGFFMLSPRFEEESQGSYVVVFFIIFCVVCAMIMSAVYLSYYYQKTNIPLSTPITILRNVVYLWTTIFYLPVIEFVTSTWNCESNGRHAFVDMVCWEGIHIVLVVFAILLIMMLIPISVFLVITFYEPRFVSSDSVSQKSSRAYLYLIIYQSLLALSFSIMTGSQFIYILLVILIGGAIINFVAFTISQPYHQKNFQMLSASEAAITMWSAIMLCLAKLMEGQVFQGSVIAWMIGVPFIVVIIMTNRDRQIESLIVNVNKFANADELIDQSRYLLFLIRAQSTDRQSAILLDGYVEVHKQVCNKDDCPLKQKKQKNHRITRALIAANGDGFSEKHALLLQMIYKMYMAGIKKFPNNTDLRIQFCFFLLDHMKYKQQALTEINTVDQFRPSFDQQFIVFRYKRIIEMELQESRKEDFHFGMDMIPSSAAPPLISALAQSIEKSALLHMEFWSQLGEDTPDIGKLEVVGTRTMNSIQEVHLCWMKLQKVAPNHLKSVRLYGRYLIEILSDEEGGEEILQRLRLQDSRPKDVIEEEDGDNYTNDPLPVFIVSCDSERFGQIVQLNQAGASLLWYSKSELINQKIQMIMPKLYAKQHDMFLEAFLNNVDGKQHVRDRVVFTRNKSGYIMQTLLQIKQLQSAIQGVSFLGTLQVERQFKPIAYILVDDEGNIEGISTSCINLLKIDLKYIMNHKKLHEIMPGIIEDRNNYIGKTGQPYTYHLPNDIAEQIVKQTNELYNQEHETQINMLCSISELYFATQSTVQGYVIKLEKVGELSTNNTNLNSSMISKKSNNQLHPPPKAKPKSTFFLYYQMTNSTFHGEFADNHQYSDIISQRHDETIAELQEYNFKQIDTHQKEQHNILMDKQLQLQENTRFNYADGIKTVRLFKGRVGEIEDVNEEEMDQEEQEYEQQLQNQQQNQYYDENDDHHNDSLLFKSRRNLNALFSKQATPPAVRNMKLVSSGLMIILTVLAFVDYFLNVQQLSDIISNIDIINQNNFIKADFQAVLSTVLDLQLLNMGLYGKKYLIQNQTAFNDQLGSLLLEIESNLNTMQLSSLQLSDEAEKLHKSTAITMVFSPIKNDTFDIVEATQQMIAKSFNIKNSNLSDLTMENDDVYFVQTNGFNNFLRAEVLQSNYFFEDFISRTADKSSKFLIIVIIVASTILLSVFVLFPVLLSIRFTKEEVVKLFLEVPDKVVKQLYAKAENFVSSLQIGDEDDNGSEMEDMQERLENENDPMLGGQTSTNSRKKRRKYKSTAGTQYQFFLKLVIGAIVVQGYFVYNYLIGKQLMSDFSQLAPEANATTQAESLDAIYYNAEKLLFFDSSLYFFGIPVKSISDTIVDFMYQQDSDIHQQHSDNVQIHNSVYNDAFNQIMMQDPCPLLNVDVLQCQKFADGSVAQGLAVALTRYYENIRYLLTLYMKIQVQPNITFEELVPQGGSKVFVTVTGDRKKDNELNLLNLPESIESKELQFTYFKQGFRYLMRKFRESLDSSQSSFVSQRTALFIVFDMMMLAVYLFYWLPLNTQLGQEIWKTRSQLTMIPVNQIIRLKNIKGYIRMIMNDSVQHD